MFGYIYKTTNLITGKIYIGKRKSNFFVKNYFGSGSYIKRSILKYGKENFKVKLIFACKTKYQLNQKEIYFIAFHDARNINKGYNIHVGGRDGDTLSKHPDKINIIKKRSKTFKSNYKKGKYIVWNKNKKNCFSKLSIRKRLSTIKKRYGKIIPWNKNKKLGNAPRWAVNKRIKARMGYRHSKLTIALIQKNRTPNRKPVYIFDINGNFLISYKSINECQNINNLHNIHYMCKHELYAYGLYFSFNRKIKIK